MTKAAQIATQYGTKTDLIGRLSYDSGVKNIIDVENTNMQVRLRYVNKTTTDQLVYICPSDLIGFPTTDLTKNLAGTAYNDTDNHLDLFYSVLQAAGLPTGRPFYIRDYQPDKSKPTENLTAASLDADQNISLLATSMNKTPIQIKSLIFRSFDISGNPENSNYGNTLTHYNINAYREKKRQNPINMADYQSSKDMSTEILKINLLKQNIVVPISDEDVFAFKINAGTKMDITINVGARDSRQERFFRDLKVGTQVLISEFGGATADCNC